ncbi:mucin-2-like [Scylla paramamosain]|uniref:mucin-2-like n=1 Tax=Scylla paramamosain TaxID=85552 RepID=UPI0030839870
MPASVASGGGSGASGGGKDTYGIVASRHFESGPPPSKMQLCQMDDGEMYETVKEEEWLTRKKVTTTTTKNIETRTQREVMLEDGEVVGDSGPLVTQDCTENTVTNEVVADEHLTPEGQEGAAIEAPGEDWIPVGGAVVVSEKKEHILTSHQVAEDRRETEEVVHLGNVTNQEVEDHKEGKADLRALTEARQERGWEVARPEKRVVHESAKKWGTVDTEDVHETSRIQDGHVVTETERTTQHEVYENESLPDSGSSLSDGSVHEEARETQHNIVHTKDEDIVEYYGVPKGGTLAQGVKLGEGMHVVSEDFHEDREGEDLDSLSERIRRGRRLGILKPKTRDTTERTDAITRRPLDYHEEEETRKSETNRWLENHFGSESGHSGSSHHDPEEEGGLHTAGGNVITITMSPRPATPEDVPDAAPSARRQWDSPAAPTFARSSNNKAPPPPPPPKPTSSWTSPSAASPRQQGPPSMPSEEITHSMIAEARSKLRSTGRILDESENSTPPTSPPANGVRYSGPQERVQVFASSPSSFPSPPVSPTGRVLDDPVYNSKFRSGSPSGLVSSRLFSTPSRSSRPATRSPSDSPPPPLPSTPPPTQSNNVGRSQSFNVTNKNWINSGSKTLYSRPLNSRLKEFRSEEQLDGVGHPSPRRWTPSRRELSPEPPREVTPPPPPRSRNSHSIHSHYNTAPTRSSRASRTTEIATQTIARDSATQTASSPVPPPRTKRKHKPKTYYFGQESAPSISSERLPSRGPITTTTSVSYSSTRRDNQSSPKVERRFRTTKTITPVVVPANTHTEQQDKLKNRSWHYRSMDELRTGAESTARESWTNTIDPRRKPRHYSHTPKEPETQTLPKKLSNGTASPSRTYIFGSDRPDHSSGKREVESRSSSSHLHRSYGGSMVNVSLAGMSSPKSSVYKTEVQDKPAPPRTVRPVLRSHSLNIKPAPLKAADSPTEAMPPTTSLSSTQRTSTMYRSSPYLNLRSPNLIATIARSNSTRRTDSYEEEDEHEHDRSPGDDRHRSVHTSHHTSRHTTTNNITNNTNNTNNNRYTESKNYSSHIISNNTRNANNNTDSNRNTRNTPVANNDNTAVEEKRNRFMKDLLATAPELFHAIHGEDDGKKGNESGKGNQSPPESPPQLIRPPGSPLTSPPAASPTTTTAPRVFTFGRGEGSSVKRSPSAPHESNNNRLSSQGRSTLSSSRDNLSSPQRNSLTSQYHRQAQLMNSNPGTVTNSLNRPKFNLKSDGRSSLLYSTSFRNRAEQQQQQASLGSRDRRGSDPRDHKPHTTPGWRDHHAELVGKHQGNVTSNLTRDGAVLIPIRDWNSR